MRTTSNSFSVLFHLRIEKEKDSKLPVYARITINGKRIELSVKQMMNPKDWNEKRGMANPTNEDYKKLNNYLEQLRSSYVECYRLMCFHKKDITTENFKKAFNGVPDDEYTLVKLMNYNNIDMKESLSWGTMKNYYTTQKYQERFLKKKHNKTDILLREINYKFVTDFEYYLKTYKPLDHQKKLHNNGVMKHMERFRKMINVALKNEWMEKDPFKAYRPKFTKFERGCLTDGELARIETKQFTIERLHSVKDLLIFSCYTGLAYKDAVDLKPANIIRGIDNTLWLITQRAKTGVSVKVPILPKALQIIEKYKDDIKCKADESLLPKMSNQRLNGYLKELGDLCGITKHLTFHLARHTFATTVTLSNGAPIESVSKMLGHTKISTTPVYAKVVERKLSDDMALLREKLAFKENKDQIISNVNN
ncbi:MAG: site-specific integrase [Ginsengibacter sp.]